MSTWSTSGASGGSSPGRSAGAHERLGLDVLELLGVGGLGDVAVLGVAETGEDLVHLLALRREADDVDVGVLAVHEIEVGAVAAHGESAGESQLDALFAGRVDHGHGLGHQPVGAPGRRRPLTLARLEHGAGWRRPAARRRKSSSGCSTASSTGRAR